jgi:hypothetical protein
MTAKTGSWLLFKLMGELRKIIQKGDDDVSPAPVTMTDDQKKENAEQMAKVAITVMLQNIDEDLFGKVQTYALEVCGEYKMVGEEEVVLPVLMPNGNFSNPDLRHDIMTASKLTSEALYANLSPFFLNGGLGK